MQIFKWIFCVAVLSISITSVQAKPLADGDTVIFFGDSITELGVQKKGYITLIDLALKRAYPKKRINVIGSGVAGNTVVDLQKRLQRDVLQKKPSTVVVYTGVNDIWLMGKTVPKLKFSTSLSKIVSQIKQSGVNVILVTPAVMGERRYGENRFDKALDEYAAITKLLAKRVNCEVINLRGLFLSYLEKHNTENQYQGILTKDSVHLSDEGNRLLAAELLKVLQISNI